MRLDPLYHWSPSERRKLIRSEGLQPYSDPTVCRGGVSYPYISLSPTPSLAWGLSGDMDWVSEIEEWDLWQVRLSEKAEVHVRPLWGTYIEEVKVHNVILPDCIWYVGTRSIPYGEEVKNGKKGASKKTKSRQIKKT